MKKKKIIFGASAIMLMASPVFGFNGQDILQENKSGKIHVGAPEVQKEIFAEGKSFTDQGESRFRKGASGSTLYGYMSYKDEPDFVGGWYEITPSGEATRLWQYPYGEVGAMLGSAWLYNGRLCGLGIFTMGSEDIVGDYAYQEIDPETGEILESRSISVQDVRLPYFVTAAYNPSDNRIYGFGRTGDLYDAGGEYVFKSAPAQRPEEAVVVRVLDSPGDRCYSFCYSISEDCFYGVNTSGMLVRFYTDGSSEEVMDVNVPSLANLRGGLTVSPRDGYLLWSPSCYTDVAELYAIYPGEKRFEKLHTFSTDCQFTCLLSADDTFDPAQPAAPDLQEVLFDGSSLSGTLTFTMPERAINGDSLPGILEWIVLDNGEAIKEGTAMPGESVRMEATVLQGEHTFSVQANGVSGYGYPAVKKVYIGYDNPKAPENVVVKDGLVRWEAVTAGAHGGYMDASSLRYAVWLNDELVGETDLLQLPVKIDEEKIQDVYRARVIASADGMESAPGISEKVVLGKPYTLPMQIEPTPHDWDMVTVINNDGSPDYGTWRFVEWRDETWFASGWSHEQADDWLIMPAAKFADNRYLYEVKIDAARGGYIGQREYFEVWAGDAPTVEAMTIPVIKKTRAQKYGEWKEYSGVFAVPSAGTYYVAVRGVSDPDQKDLIVKNIRVAATDILTDVPAAVEDLKVLSKSDADLTATISFVMPREYVNGKEISGKVKAIIRGASIVETEGEPGEEVEATVPTAQGENYITVTSVVNGLEGQTAEISLFTGMDMLGFCENFHGEVSEDNMSAKLTWSAPTESLNGGYISDKGIEYWIGRIDSSGEFIEEPVLAGVDITSYTYTLPTGTPQAFYRIGLAAGNAAGISNARSFVGYSLGTPYTLPIAEDFDGMEVKYGPIMTSAPSDLYSGGSWTWGQPELVDPSFIREDYDAENPRVGMVGYAASAPARVRVALPKVSTKGASEPNITFDIWSGDKAATDMGVYITSYGEKQPEKIASIPQGSGWTLYNVEIPAKFRERSWVTIYLDGYLATESNYLLFMGYSFDAESGTSDNILKEGEVIAAKGSIILKGFEGEHYSIYGADGRIVAAGETLSEKQLINITPGLYIVRVGGNSRALMVR